jgi:drug/metabolite transporter (DMT)-like permease
METVAQRFGIGLASALAVVCIWSGFIVVARFGVTNTLTIYDVAAVRFGFAGLLVLPFAIFWWPRRLPFWKCLILAAGPGVPYALLAYTGMTTVPAAHAGAVLNGSLPAFSLLLGLIWLKEKPNAWKWSGVVLVGAGSAAMGFAGGGQTEGLWTGYFFLLAASLVLTIYMLNTRMWGLRPKEMLAVVPVLNGLFILPLWPFLPSRISEAPWSEILLQMLYQGLGPSLIAVPLFVMALRHLGPTPTSALMAGVPAISALIAVPALGELPTAWEWAGMAVVTAGILFTLKRNK